jgi:hypothetical protein
MTVLRASYVLLCLAATPMAAHAQVSEWARAGVYPGYPGSFLITPQQSDYLAPAIYRSVNDTEHLGNPVEIRQICLEDIQAMVEKKIIHQTKAEAAGVENAVSFLAGGKLSADARVLKASLGAKYDHRVTLKTGPVRVFGSDDDNIASTILTNIKNKCRKTIGDHLKKKRMVFVADTAIQARDYEAVVERVAAGTGSAECGFFCRLFSVKGEVIAQYSNKSRRLAPNTDVTIALVPAEIGNRQSVNYADIGIPGTASPQTARPIGSRVREARFNPANAPDRIWPRQVQQYAYAGKTKSHLKMAKPIGPVARYTIASVW